MTLYYNKNTYELKELTNELFQAWIDANNPKKNEWILAPIKPSSTSVWNNGSWFEPEITTPQTISARQIRLWLVQHGFQLSQIDSAIDSIPDPMTREIVKIEWEYAPYIERNYPWLVPLAESLGLNETQIDQAFIEASVI